MRLYVLQNALSGSRTRRTCCLGFPHSLCALACAQGENDVPRFVPSVARAGVLPRHILAEIALAVKASTTIGSCSYCGICFAVSGESTRPPPGPIPRGSPSWRARCRRPPGFCVRLVAGAFCARRLVLLSGCHRFTVVGCRRVWRGRCSGSRGADRSVGRECRVGLPLLRSQVSWPCVHELTATS